MSASRLRPSWSAIAASTLDSRDRRRLDHRGPRPAARAVRLGAGLHLAACSRSRASRSGPGSARGSARCVLPDGAHSPWAPAFGLLGALLVGVAAGRAVRGVRRPGPARARGAAGIRGRRRRCWARVLVAVRRPRRRLDPRRARGAERRLPDAPGGAALGDPAAPQHGPAAVRAAAELAARASTRSRASTGPRRACAPPRAPASRATRRCRKRRERRQGARHRVRPRRRGLRLGRGRRPRGDERARRGRASDDTRCCSAAASRAGARRRSTSTRATTSRSSASPASTRRRCALARRASSAGTSAAILGFPLNGPFDVRAGRLGADAPRALVRRLRPRAGRALDDRAARARPLRATRAGRWSTATAAS